MVSAVNNDPGHPSMAVVFDTGNPTGGDFDLATPGPGPGNDQPLGRALILAENDIDADGDGLVDSPDDELMGGVLVIDFMMDVQFRSADVIDVDFGEVSFLEAYDADGLLLATFPLEQLGDNSVQTVVSDLFADVRRLELHLGGSGALANLVFCPEPPEDEIP